MARRVLCLVHGDFSSHTVRVLEIAKALREKYFEISFSGRGEYMKDVERAGFRCIETRLLEKKEIMSSIEEKLFPRLYDENNTNGLFEEEDKLLAREKPDMIIRDSFRELAGIAAKGYGIYDVFLEQASLTRYYHADFKPSNTPGYMKILPGEKVIKIPFTDFAPLIRIGERYFRKYGSKFLHEKAKEMGFSIDSRNYEGIEANLILIPDSEVLFPFRNMKKNYKFIGPILVLNQYEAPSWKDEFLSDKRKKIITTSGSTGVQDRGEFFAKVFCEDKYAVAINGKDKIKGFYSGEFEISSIIDNADLFITHGGQGSCYLGLTRGIPMISIYKHFEQQINSNQMKKLGVGIMLDARKISEENLRKKIEEIFRGEYKENANRVKEKINTRDSVKKAVSYIIEGYENYIR